MFVMYAVLLTAALHNTYRFIWKSERYKNFHITYFYLLIYMIIILRVTWLSLMLKAAYAWPEEESMDIKLNMRISRVDIIATYFELFVGL